MSERISIIIPVYNVEKYLDRCLESIVNQTYKDIEIILVDDGATDSSGEMCDIWKKKDARIRVIHKKNGGLSSARNAGIEVATGKYILFVDSDDCVSYDMCYKLQHIIETSGADIAVGNLCKFSDAVPKSNVSDDFKVVEKYHALEEASVDYRWVVAWCKLYKREIIGDIRFPEGKLHEDEFVIHQLYYRCKKVVYTDDVLYYYFYNANSITGQKFSIRRMDVFEALKQRLQFYEQNKEEKLYKLTVLEIITMMVSYSKLMKGYDDKTVLINMRNECRQLVFSHKKEYGITLYKYPRVYAFIYPITIPLTMLVRFIKKW